ncbi:glycoside hydrolase family 18 protein [Coniophora puteana RWD-64-598 SS2]|uniref:chitinase n=1 Tax=Coniophora puteana (strain RWD-64-598) TaxID=741705 RepID=A0A5M3ML35_CONPW|nr:glycoside hydrolase family 18 protein [Coniophora puteana RWD-64-598 SS2]EIW79375.1 glycoside hydrolase family 18 protein [Coniophora puteana RWD-64-598 SS2]
MFISSTQLFATAALAALAPLSAAVPCAGSYPAEARPKSNDYRPWSTPVKGYATPSPPHFVVYSDEWVSGGQFPPTPAQISGFTVFALSFWLSSGPADNAETWVQLDNSTRSSIKSSYEQAGIKLIVSAFGSTETPASSNNDPTQTAQNLANFVKQYDLDGVDVDFEDFDAMSAGTGVQWLTTFTQALRKQLPQGQYLLTHAPVAPWFSPGMYTDNAYIQVDDNVGNLIDWYNVQFYNQGSSEYTTCNGLLYESSQTWPNSSVFQLAYTGVEMDKIVIGKPATSGDASNGYMNTTYLAQCVADAKQDGWNAGVMVWEFPDAAASWIQSVRAKSWPVSSFKKQTQQPMPAPVRGSGSQVILQGFWERVRFWSMELIQL